MKTARVLIILLMLLPMSAWPAALELTINGGDVEPVSVAVAPFDQAKLASVDVDVARVIESDLTGSGLFSAFPRADMLERPTRPEQIELGNWRAVKVEYLVIGEVNRSEEGRWAVDFRLVNIAGGETTLGYSIPVARSGLRYTAHQISDLIYQQLTGHKGVFNTQIAYVTANGSIGNRVFQLMIADADGYNPRQLVRSNEPIMSPTWSPDGRQMAFVAFQNGNPGIYVQTINTGQVRRLTNKPGINGAPSFSPDGRRLVATLSFDGNPEIYSIDISTAQMTRLTNDPAIDTEAAWSPDGQFIIFTSDRAGRPQLYRMTASGADVRRLTFEGRSNARASFSPDGRSIALVHQNQNGFQIAVMDLATQALRVLSDGPLDESPSFAPNGVVVIYSGNAHDGAELRTVTVDSAVRSRLRQRGDVRDPAWSPFF